MTKDINKQPFDEATKTKLTLFGESFQEWLPVFIHDKYTTAIYIFDFFAGSGTDLENNLGSPLILLEKARGKNRLFCKNAKKPIRFFFNEGKTEKSKELQNNVKKFIERCKIDNKCKKCVYKYEILNYDFKKLFNEQSIKSVFEDKNIAKFVLLDQYGFSQINENVFKRLISFPKTDFIFFISSSFINRFKNHPYVKNYIDTSKIPFENKKPNEIHRAIAEYFKSLIPKNKNYYLHHFSIKKGTNYYGLIFGTSHSYGMEKFLKVCWKIDKKSGEANYNIDNNWEEWTLFYSRENTVKKIKVSKEIRERILLGNLQDNKAGLDYALKKGCEPKLFVKVVEDLIKNEKIEIIGEYNRQSTKIHKLKNIYKIRIKKEKNGKET